jgi:hypothetical protein
VDPHFVDAGHGFYGLGAGSACIDAGGSTCSSLDPDGTDPDLGKRSRYFRQVDHVPVAEHPHGEPVVVPRDGGTVSLGAWVTNPTDSSQVVDAWGMVAVLEIGDYGPLETYRGASLSAGGSVGRSYIEETVPASAPAGEYQVTVYVGEQDSLVVDSASFTFVKEE